MKYMGRAWGGRVSAPVYLRPAPLGAGESHYKVQYKSTPNLEVYDDSTTKIGIVTSLAFSGGQLNRGSEEPLIPIVRAILPTRDSIPDYQLTNQYPYLLREEYSLLYHQWLTPSRLMYLDR